MSLKKKILLTAGSIVALVTIAIVVLYFWAISHASTLLTKLVNDQSKGKLALTVKKVDFSLFKLRIVFTEPDLKTKDSTDQTAGYHITAKNITLKVQSAFTFIFQKQLIVDSIIVNEPSIEIFKYKEGPQKKVSLPEEFSKLYQSLDSVLQKVTLNYLHFDSAKFTIYDRTKPGIAPLQISNLNLTINLASSAGKSAADNRFLFADRILLEVFDQDIQFKDGLQGIKFKRLRLSTGSKTLKLDSCNLYGRKSDSTYGALDISFDSIRISNIDFNSLVKNNILKLDSALCISPHVKLQVAIKEKKEGSGVMKNLPADKDSIDLIFKKLLGNIDIGYLAFINASINLDTKKDGRITTRSADKIDFGIKNLVIINDTAIPIQLGNLELAVRNYTAYKLDSLTTVKFDSIKLINNKIRLANFSLSTTKDNQQLSNSTIKTDAFELTNINWTQLIYEQRLEAGTASLINPEVNLNLPDKNTKRPIATKAKPTSILTEIKDRIKLKNFFIVNGVVNIKTANDVSVSVDHCSADVKITQFLKENSLKNMVDAVGNLSFAKASFVNRQIQVLVKGGHYSGANKSLIFAEVKQTKTDKNTAASFKNLEVSGININEGNDFSVSNVSWSNADITINKKQTGTKKSIADTTAKYKIVVNNTSGGPTRFSYNGTNIAASTQIDKLSVDEIILQAGEKPVIVGLKVDGHPILVNQNKTESGIDVFNISDKNVSVLRNVTLRLPAKEKTMKIFLPELIFSADINKSINGLITADYIEMNRPVISFESQMGGSENKPEPAKHKLPLMQIGTLKINEPSIESLPENSAKKMRMSAGISEFTLKGISSDGQAIRLDSILGTLKNPNFNNSKISLVPTGKEFIRLVASDFTFSPWADSSSEKWAFKLNALQSSNFLIHTKRSDTIKQIITVKNLNLEALLLSSVSIKNYKDLLRNNDRFLLSKGDVAIDNGKTIIAVNNLQVDRRNNKLSLDSFSFYPAMDRDSFIKTKTFQAPPYITLKTANILVNGINYEQLINDTAFAAKKINLAGCYLYLYKDKRLPFEYGIEKPMLTELIGRIKLKINIDSILLSNSHIQYEEMNDKTLLLGKVKISEMRGNITRVKNFNYAANDSLRFTVSSRIMDSARVKVKYAQSYTDSLAAFVLQVNIRPFNLTALNPMLEPLVSARVRSGYLDTVSMIAIGRRYVAWGKMKMYYRDLDFQYLDKGSVVKKTFKTKLITFFGNLVVHKKNTKGTGDIYTERISEKGFPNYWIRILLSGALTNTGIRTNKKAEKKYYEGIKKFDVPPITEITIEE